MSNSIQSTALEPTKGELKNLSRRQKLLRLLPSYGLVILTVLLAVLFSILQPDTFPTWLTLRANVADKAIVLILALAVMIPMSAGRIDLTVGFGIGLWHIVVLLLQTKYGFAWPAAVAIVLALGMIMGFINGWLVENAKIDAFIATLGTGNILYATSLQISGGTQVVGKVSDSFYALSTTSIFDLPITGYYVLVLALIMWVVYEYLPVGRYLYAIGASSKAAALNGIPVRKYVIGSFVASGFLIALAGVLLASRLRIAQASVGPEYMLPALVGAFLGSTTIRPGRVNVWGTVIGIAILAVGISGILQYGFASSVEPYFNGITLLIAVGIAGYAQRRKGAATKSK